MKKKNWRWRKCKSNPPPSGLLCIFHTRGVIESYFVCFSHEHGKYHKGELWMALPRVVR